MMLKYQEETVGLFFTEKVRHSIKRWFKHSFEKNKKHEFILVLIDVIYHEQRPLIYFKRKLYFCEL